MAIELGADFVEVAARPDEVVTRSDEGEDVLIPSAVRITRPEAGRLT